MKRRPYRVDVAERGRLIRVVGGERLEPVVLANEEHGLLGGEVSEERSGRHAGFLRDRLGRRVVVALLREQLERGLLQQALRSHFVRLPARRRRGGRSERLGHEGSPDKDCVPERTLVAAGFEPA